MKGSTITPLHPVASKSPHPQGGKRETSAKKKKLGSSSRMKDVEAFFDPKVTAMVYGPRPQTTNQRPPKSSSRLGVSMVNGQLSLNQQLLKEDCERDFSKKWFFEEEKKKLLINRTASAKVFEVDKADTLPMILPRSELNKKQDRYREKFKNMELLDEEEALSDPGETALHKIDPFYSTQPDALLASDVNSARLITGDSFRSAQSNYSHYSHLSNTNASTHMNSEMMSVARLLHDMDASVLSAPYEVHPKPHSLSSNEAAHKHDLGSSKLLTRPSTAPSNSSSALYEPDAYESHRMRQFVAEKQQRALGTLQRSKSGTSRPHNPAKVVSPDYVLLLEALRRDVLCYPSSTIDSHSTTLVFHDDETDLFNANRHNEDGNPKTSFFRTQSAPSRASTAAFTPKKSTLAHSHSFVRTESAASIPSFVEGDLLEVSNSRVLSLDLSDKSIGPDRAQCLAVALQYCPHLQTLKLRNNRLNDISLSVLLQAVFGFASQSLKYLDISKNDANKSTVSILCGFFETIHADSNNATSHHSSVLGHTLEENDSVLRTDTLREKKCVLEYFNFSSCNLGDELAGKLARSLCHNNTIRELHMATNRIGCEETKASLSWADLIQKNTTLQVLDLSNNYLRKYSAQMLLKSLHFNRSLVSLNLASNQISDNDALCSAAFLEKNTILQSLDLSSNLIESKGCIALSYCLSQPSCLNFTLLNLLGNKIGDIAYKFATERVLFVLHQNHEMHYAALFQETHREQSRAEVINPSLYAKKAPPPPKKERTIYDDLYGIEDEDAATTDKESSSAPSAAVEKELPKARVYRLLNILCRPTAHEDRVNFSQTSLPSSSRNNNNLKDNKNDKSKSADAESKSRSVQTFSLIEVNGKCELNLADPFDAIRARILMDTIERNPCVSVKEMSYFNDVSRNREFVSVSRSVYSKTETVRAFADAAVHHCTDERRSLTNTTPRFVYDEEHDVIMSSPFDKARNLTTLLYKLVYLLNRSTEEKLTASHLLEVKNVLLEVGNKLSMNFQSDILFFLIERWNRFDALCSTYKCNEIYTPWREEVDKVKNKQSRAAAASTLKLSVSSIKRRVLGGESTSAKSGKSSKSVYQDIEEKLRKDSMLEGEALLVDPLVVLKFIVCCVYDFILDRAEEVNLEALYKNQQLLQQARIVSARHVTLPPPKIYTKKSKFAAMLDLLLPPRHDKVEMNSYELLVRMISELSLQYNTNPVVDRARKHKENGGDGAEDDDSDSSTSTASPSPHTPSRGGKATGPKAAAVSANESEIDDEELEDPASSFSLQASHFVQYILLQLLQYTMLSCPYQSVSIVSNSFSDFRNDLPSHGSLSVDVFVPRLESTFHRSFSREKHYLFDAWLALLSFDHAAYHSDNVIYSTPNDTNKLFANVTNLKQNLLQILEYDDNLLQLTCEQAEIVLKLVSHAKDRYHMHIIERLMLQICTAQDVSRFVVRNCYFHEIIWLRKKLGYLFRVLINNPTGHYMLDLSVPLHRLAARRLAAWHNEQLYLMQHHLQSNKSGLSTSQTSQSAQPRDDAPSEFVVSAEMEALFFRNPSYNGRYVPLTANWLQDPPAVGKLRFDYMSFANISDDLIAILPASSVSHTTLNGWNLLETHILREDFHLLHAGSYGSALNFFGVPDARESVTSKGSTVTASLMHRTQIDNAYNRVYSHAFQHWLHRQDRHPLDPRALHIDSLRKEALADSLVHQISTNDVYNKSQRIYRKLKIPAKNALVFDMFDPACREYVRKLLKAERENAAAKPSTQQNVVLSIMLRKYNHRGTSSNINTNNRNTLSSNPVAENDNSSEEDHEEGEEESEGSDLDSDESDREDEEKEKDNKQGISKQSYFRLQDETNNLETGARQAFLMQHNNNTQAPPVTNEQARSVENGTAEEDLRPRVLAYQAPLKRAKNSHVDRHFDGQSLQLWRDYMETCWSVYDACFQDFMLKKSANIFSVMQKEGSKNKQFHYSFGMERGSFPDEVLYSEQFHQLARTNMQQAIEFKINPFMLRRKTIAKKKTMLLSTSSLSTPDNSSKTTMIVPRRTPTMNLTGSLNKSVSLGNLLGTSSASEKTVDLYMPVILQCVPYDLSLLVLETCLLYHVWLETVQVRTLLETLKSQRAPSEVMVRAVTILWRNVIDREELPHCVRSVCGETVYEECIHRFGLLHFWSPMHPEGKYEFDLTDSEHRDVLRMLASLLAEDETIELLDCKYQPSRLHPFERTDISLFALPTSPHSIGLKPAASQSAAPPQVVSSKKRTKETVEKNSKGNSSEKNAKSSKEPMPFVPLVTEKKTGRVILRVRSKELSRISSTVTFSAEDATVAEKAQDALASKSMATNSLVENNPSSPLEIQARQQAVRRVFTQYKQTLIHKYVLTPSLDDNRETVMSPTFGYGLLPFFK